MAVSSTEADLVLRQREDPDARASVGVHSGARGQRRRHRGTVATMTTYGTDRPYTRVVNLHGRLAIPAFGDAHVHPIQGGLESSAVT